ncbi:hypothetical protein [Prevotella sp.]|uniref:hypothetical protein n=1 Tax=Prevotella sp. TaxID=59823 RepID=UPI00307C10F5
MIKRIGHFINIILLSLAVLTIGSCDRHGTAWNEMDKAENLMDAKPDSTLVVLENIPSSSVKGKEAAARYALLKSIALDKNYIDTTNFDVLQPAIDYYIKNGKPDEKLRTYYYQGRIYQNQGDDDSAMQSFMNACDLRKQVTDSLLLSHTLVAQGTLYLKQYKINDFVHYNMEAAKLYKTIGKDILAIKSYTNALDGYVMQNNKPAADSLMSICVPMVKKNPEGEAFLFPSLLSYTVNFCSSDEIKEVLTEYQNMELTTDETMIFAEGYSKIGEYDKAMTLISNINPTESTWDSLKYASIKIDILERQGKYKEAFTLYRDYSASLEHYQKELLSQDLLFSDKKHQLEMKSLMEIQDRDRIIWGTLCGIFALVIIIGWLYYRGYRSKTKHILTEKENKNLRLEQENLRLEIDQLEDERDHLKELQKEQSELSKPIKDVIKSRLDLLNGLLAKEITNNDRYAEPYNKWIDTVRNDKNKFMDSTRLAFAASHQKFMEYLEQHGLSTDEINYLCLYAIGLRGKEVGEYTQMKRHYIVSHEIRKKLGIDEHETNIGPYIRRLMKGLE